ncbi:MAG: hypothetical protein HY075_12625 [Deltaproteobacteria bacterium]|nr:hypothetical protein [Deltaproteobacteria bacterium]
MAFENPYAQRIGEFASFVFNEPDIDRAGKWRDFFVARAGADPRRLICEVGCSNAFFLGDIAARNQNTGFVGIDWKFKIVYKGARRVESLGLKNVALLRCHAQLLTRIFGEGEVDELWVFFPDPWAKKPQLKHRLLQESFLGAAHRVLKPGGRLYVKTDHPGYFQWLLALFGAEQPPLPEYSARNPAVRSYSARQVKVRRLEDDNLPPPSDVVRRAFALERYSTDYWGGSFVEPAAMFAGAKTLFEETFVKEGLPIYYLELARLP